MGGPYDPVTNNKYSNSNEYLFININQLDALNFIISLFQAPTCFGHMCSPSGEQNCIIQSLVSSDLQVAVLCTD